ncbi:hypothetical protein NPIL_264421 [Nephila pilipes]|uniref:Uncharacterized protein n=1 Tax=Nephila pilipes TaxID=299642 RepID=A0A8X6UCI4_NEPPI|nr:hypothetical protein NPIL_264421 [Nephila pilipes]
MKYGGFVPPSFKYPLLLVSVAQGNRKKVTPHTHIRYLTRISPPFSSCDDGHVDCPLHLFDQLARVRPTSSSVVFRSCEGGWISLFSVRLLWWRMCSKKQFLVANFSFQSEFLETV